MLKIGYLPGDGVGKEVLAEGRKVLDALEEIDWVDYPYSGEHYLKTGELLPDDALEEMKKLNAIYLGAVGHPKVKPGIIEREVLLKLRFGLDLYANIRPVKIYPNIPIPIQKKIDIYFVRENTEDFYVGISGNHKDSSFQVGIITKKGSERIMEYGFELAKKKKKNLVTSVDKANVLNFYHLWRESFEKVGSKFPDIKKEFVFVDAMALYLVTKPDYFQVVVTPNMFGDILTDLSAALQGGMGMASSGNIHPGKIGMFEPVHGSAPDIAGKGIANPYASILSAAMMLDFLGKEKSAQKIEEAVKKALMKNFKTPDIGGKNKTSEVGEAVLKELK